MKEILTDITIFNKSIKNEGGIKNKLEIKYIKKLKKVDNEDQETAHIEADWILCELLKELGFNKLVKKYQDIPKWYA